MGKRTKTPKSVESYTKKKKTIFNNLEENLEVKSKDEPYTKKQKGGKKNKEKIAEDLLEVVNEDSKLDEIVPQLEKTGKSKKCKTKRKDKNNFSSSNSQPKKIVFVDDEPQEIPATAQLPNNTVKQKKSLNNDEAEVKDEDIDKFCDDIDEEDNKQYEDWVKLIEAKLHENKKSI